MLSLVPLSAGLIEHLALVAGAAGVGSQLPSILSNVTAALTPKTTGAAPTGAAQVVGTLTFGEFQTLSATSQTAFLASGGHIVGA